MYAVFLCIAEHLIYIEWMVSRILSCWILHFWCSDCYSGSDWHVLYPLDWELWLLFLVLLLNYAALEKSALCLLPHVCNSDNDTFLVKCFERQRWKRCIGAKYYYSLFLPSRRFYYAGRKGLCAYKGRKVLCRAPLWYSGPVRRLKVWRLAFSSATPLLQIFCVILSKSLIPLVSQMDLLWNGGHNPHLPVKSELRTLDTEHVSMYCMWQAYKLVWTAHHLKPLQ